MLRLDEIAGFLSDLEERARRNRWNIFDWLITVMNETFWPTFLRQVLPDIFEKGEESDEYADFLNSLYNVDKINSKGAQMSYETLNSISDFHKVIFLNWAAHIVEYNFLDQLKSAMYERMNSDHEYLIRVSLEETKRK